MDQVEAGTDQSLGGRRKDSPIASLDDWTVSCFSVEFIPCHKWSITHRVELPNAHTSKQIQWVLGFEHTQFSTM